MLKLIGVFLFFIGSAVFVYKYNEEEKEKIKKNENLMRLFHFVNINVLEKKMVLANAFFDTKGHISNYIDIFLEEYSKIMVDNKIADKYTQREIIINLMNTYFIQCNHEILDNIISYISILGTTDKKTSLENFNLILKDCENIILNVKETYKKNIRLTRTMTYGAASLTVIILV